MFESAISGAAKAAMAILGKSNLLADSYLLAEKWKLEEHLKFIDKKFGVLGNNLYTLIKALGYFDDAEEGAMPVMIKKLTWDEVKSFLSGESMRLARKYL